MKYRPEFPLLPTTHHSSLFPTDENKRAYISVRRLPPLPRVDVLYRIGYRKIYRFAEHPLSMETRTHRQAGSNGLREIVGDFGHRVDQQFPRCQRTFDNKKKREIPNDRVTDRIEFVVS